MRFIELTQAVGLSRGNRPCGKVAFLVAHIESVEEDVDHPRNGAIITLSSGSRQQVMEHYEGVMRLLMKARAGDRCAM
jgi:hypothetical protein